MTKSKVLELLKPIIVAEIVSLKKHEDADRLYIVQLNVGDADVPDQLKSDGGLIQIVTAADNIKEGDLVPYLPSGNLVPGAIFKDGSEFRLESRKMRGEISHGMILAEDEVGISDDHTGIIIIDDQNSKIKIQKSKEEIVGKSFVEVLSEETLEMIMDRAGVVKITPELQEKIDLIKSIAEDGGELVGEDELPGILTSGETLYTYDGFEPSGQMHIAQGIIRAINTNKMIKAGFIFRMWVADWFGYLNNKMGGDLEKIKDVGRYFIEIWKAAGMDLDNTEFHWTSDAVKDPAYWEVMMKVAKHSTLKRILRTTEIMGRSETDDLSAAQILYPAMQTTDVFHALKVQVTQLGMDQRKVNMLAREIGPEIGFWKPVVLSHGMLQGLQKPKRDYFEITYKEVIGKANIMHSTEEHNIMGRIDGDQLDLVIGGYLNGGGKVILKPGNKIKIQSHEIEVVNSDNDNNNVDVVIRLKTSPEFRAISMKMSKSKPDTAIFMTDTRKDIERKINKAYCPEGEVEDNPILAYCKQIIFQAHHLKRETPLLKDGKFVVERDKKFGGNIEFGSYEELVAAYEKGGDTLHPADLKKSVINYLDELLKPVRKHFEENQAAKVLLEKVKSYQVTR